MIRQDFFSPPLSFTTLSFTHSSFHLSEIVCRPVSPLCLCNLLFLSSIREAARRHDKGNQWACMKAWKRFLRWLRHRRDHPSPRFSFFLLRSCRTRRDRPLRIRQRPLPNVLFAPTGFKSIAKQPDQKRPRTSGTPSGRGMRHNSGSMTAWYQRVLQMAAPPSLGFVICSL